VLHIEPGIPAAGWSLVVDGLVAARAEWSLASLQAMASEKRVWDLHCVWGWTRLACEWEGVPAGRLIDAARPLSEGRYVVASSVGNAYASCLTLNRARRCLLAWRLDGADLTPEHGWPLRLVPPPTKWGYKGVKWVSRLTLIEEFTPGLWESLVGDPHGDIPQEVLDHTTGEVDHE
jgi:DMSO/TMAO reductase YedYZ molybdopterin-dependent catalytic subunit